MPPVKFFKRETKIEKCFFVIQKRKKRKKKKKKCFLIFLMFECVLLILGLMTTGCSDSGTVKKRIGSRFAEKSKTRKRELENKRNVSFL